MIEVELRGRLTKISAVSLKKFLRQNGKHIESHYREQIQLLDHPGYTDNPVTRPIDIRLRNTDSRCEIMIKTNASSDNAGRHEFSIPLRDKNLEHAKQMVKMFGCARGLLMRRRKDIYRYKGVEWSIVDCGKNIYFFEVEQRVHVKKNIGKAREKILREIDSRGLQAFTSNEFHEFTKFLSRTVNKKIHW